ncbi:MAG: hypothetical protein ACOYEN_09720, partial [Limnochordia bacterium]
RILTSVVKSSLASLVMGVVVYLSSNLVGQWVSLATTRGRLLQMAIPMLIGIIVYGVFLLAFRMEELEFLLSAVKGRKKRLPAKE